MSEEHVIAAIDVGTNSFHMVVARSSVNQSFDVIAREKVQVRLGEGPGDMKRLSEDAIERGVEALAGFRSRADAHGAIVRAIATSAVREAGNHHDFVRRAQDEAGVEVEVVSGVEEARLIHLGILSSLPVYDRRLLLCDIGGGSTELLIGERSETLAVRSLKLGAVRLTNRFFDDDDFSDAKVRACRRYIAGAVLGFDPAVRQHGFDLAIGSSGTIEQVARIALGSSDNPRTLSGATVSAAAVAKATIEIIQAAQLGKLAELPGLEARRIDIVLAGALILDGVIDRIGIKELTISETALREGVLVDTLARLHDGGLHHLTDVARRSVAHLASSADDDRQHSQRVAVLALQLFDDLNKALELPPEARDHLEAAALLANVGLMVSHSSHHKHSYYVIRHTERLMGFTDAEIERIALVARYHRKSAPKAAHPEFARLEPPEQAVVRALAGLLRVAIGLDRTHSGRVESVGASIEADRLELVIRPVEGQDVGFEAFAAQERSGLLAGLLSVSSVVTIIG